ncbi:K(+)-transporting ATPase subunit F [Acidithiobacillus sulfuriphilus]|uniref:K(+)-transporting ATPase subunit F n=1 Tax=Acidithiobacillus sulfuriphilus TaxID=1867749 RepID=UPI003F63A6DA
MIFYGFFTALGITLKAEQGSAELSRHPLRGGSSNGHRLFAPAVTAFFPGGGFCGTTGSHEEVVMTIFTWIGLGLAVGLLVYLLFFLLNPERFL